ncbi:hypothetical protein SLS55_003162 [Diplodia seriata]|uniref:Uncharacterized protein n=1 Tax=Diplodia seriata TaxID=420778 RepID=A0ABR3CM74_9PEZI
MTLAKFTKGTQFVDLCSIMASSALQKLLQGILPLWLGPDRTQPASNHILNYNKPKPNSLVKVGDVMAESWTTKTDGDDDAKLLRSESKAWAGA